MRRSVGGGKINCQRDRQPQGPATRVGRLRRWVVVLLLAITGLTALVVLLIPAISHYDGEMIVLLPATDDRWETQIYHRVYVPFDIDSMMLSSDRAQVLVGWLGEETGAALVDVRTGAKTISVETRHWIHSVAISPDGAWFAGGQHDGTTTLWDAQSGEEIHRFAGRHEPIGSLAFSPDGTGLFAGDTEGWGALWDVESRKLICELEGDSWLVCAAFSPDGAKIVTGSDNHLATLWDARSGERIRLLEGHAGWVFSVAFSPDGSQILTGSSDKTAALWGAGTGERIRLFEHDAEVTAVAWSADGSRALAGWGRNHSCRVALWDVATGRMLRTFEASGGIGTVGSGPLVVDFSTDQRRVLVGLEDGSLVAFDADDPSSFVRLIILDGSDWLAVTSDGHFDGTPDGRCGIRYRVDNRWWSRWLTDREIDQRFRRPELVAQRLREIP